MNAQTTMAAARTSAGTGESVMSATAPRATSCWTKRRVEVKTRDDKLWHTAKSRVWRSVIRPSQLLAEVTFTSCVELQHCSKVWPHFCLELHWKQLFDRMSQSRWAEPISKWFSGRKAVNVQLKVIERILRVQDSVWTHWVKPKLAGLVYAILVSTQRHHDAKLCSGFCYILKHFASVHTRYSFSNMSSQLDTQDNNSKPSHNVFSTSRLIFLR